MHRGRDGWRLGHRPKASRHNGRVPEWRWLRVLPIRQRQPPSKIDTITHWERAKVRLEHSVDFDET